MDNSCRKNTQVLPDVVNHPYRANQIIHEKPSSDDEEWEPEVVPSIPPVMKTVHYSDDDDWEVPDQGQVWTSTPEFDFNTGGNCWENGTVIAESSSHQDVSSNVNSVQNRTIAFAKRNSNRPKFPGNDLSQCAIKSNKNQDIEMIDASLCDKLANVSLKPQNGAAGATEFRRGMT